MVAVGPHLPLPSCGSTPESVEVSDISAGRWQNIILSQQPILHPQAKPGATTPQKATIHMTQGGQRTTPLAMEREHLALRMLAIVAADIVNGEGPTEAHRERLAWVEVHLRPGLPRDSSAITLLETLSAKANAGFGSPGAVA